MDGWPGTEDGADERRKAVTTKAVLITGCSTGIGEACALHLAEKGYDVYAGVRRRADGERLSREATGKLTPLTVEVTDECSIAEAVSMVESRVGDFGLRGLVNNAGISRGGPIEYLPSEEWRAQFEVNVIGQVAVTRAALPLVRQGGGRIVFMGSTAGRLAPPLFGPYSASKFALEGIAECLRHELHPWGIPVVLIEPGAVRTSIWAKGRALADELERLLPEEAAARYGGLLATTRRVIDYEESHGVPPLEVAKVVERALSGPRPRPRYLIGMDAQAAGVITRFLPDRARDTVFRQVSSLV